MSLEEVKNVIKFPEAGDARRDRMPKNSRLLYDRNNNQVPRSSNGVSQIRNTLLVPFTETLIDNLVIQFDPRNLGDVNSTRWKHTIDPDGVHAWRFRDGNTNWRVRNPIRRAYEVNKKVERNEGQQETVIEETLFCSEGLLTYDALATSQTKSRSGVSPITGENLSVINDLVAVHKSQTRFTDMPRNRI